MGGTWKNDTMFDSVFTENNLQQLLYKAGVETISVDYDNNDTYQSLIKDIGEITPEVDYIMGYSFGVLIAIATAQQNTKGLILLDANSIGGNDCKTYIEDKQIANKYFERDLQSRNEKLKNFTEGKLTISPHKPETLLVFSDFGDKNNNLCTHGMYLRMLGKLRKKVIRNSSHFIMLEPARFELAKEI